jgi:hypothetical protein
MLCSLLLAGTLIPARATKMPQRTQVEIRGSRFYLNGSPTYSGRTFEGRPIEGLLMNSRMVQGIFDDLNPASVSNFHYPDTGKWDAERNVREFIAAMPDWKAHGCLCFDINLQGGNPRGYARDQPWHNSAFNPDGSLRPDYLARLKRILDRADELGMVPLVGYFYFGQDQRLVDEAAVIRATDNATHWLLNRGYRNVLVEVNNECNVRYDHAILKPDRIHELIERVKSTQVDGRRLLVSTSYGGRTIPRENVVQAADYLLLHGNGVKLPDEIREMVRATRRVPGYREMPILFNEDDHFEFDAADNHFRAAVGEYCSWGLLDIGEPNYRDGFQAVPVNWRWDSSERKRQFFTLCKKITGF